MPEDTRSTSTSSVSLGFLSPAHRTTGAGVALRCRGTPTATTDELNSTVTQHAAGDRQTSCSGPKPSANTSRSWCDETNPVLVDPDGLTRTPKSEPSTPACPGGRRPCASGS